jgi:VWFA-related protein
MRTLKFLWLAGLALGIAAATDDSTPTFRSDVAMGRIDALVMDRSQHPIGGLQKDDFVLRQDGKPLPIRDIAYEDLPVDVLLLLDVSGSMRPHVQRVASAAHEALAVLGPQDRVGIMIFDTQTRLRLSFDENLGRVERRLDDVVETERFNGGTKINEALLDAAAYVEHEGRKRTRHAIIIVTDDQAPPCDRNRVQGALDRADAVLMVLLAPQFMGYGGTFPRRGGPARTYPPVGSPWPGAGGPLGGIILGPRRGPARNPRPGSPPVAIGYPVEIWSGAPEIAKASGGDSLNINDAYSVENTFERIRRRYAIYFYLPDGMAMDRGMALDLTDSARRRHPDASLQYRQSSLAADGARPGLLTRIPAHAPTGRDPEVDAPVTDDASAPPSQRRRGVSQSTGQQVLLPIQNATPADAVPVPASRRRGVSDPGNAPRVTIEPVR